MIIALVFLSGLPCLAQDATEIVRRADEKMRGKTSEALLTVQTIRPRWSRDMTIKSWTKGKDLVMILVTAPAKDKGISFLKRKKEVWNWIPSIERNIKLPPSMMSQSWMGTDFTNDDLVKEASIVEDYNQQLSGDSIIGDRPCHVIDLVPKPNTAVVWGRLRMYIDKKDDIMMLVHYYDEDMQLINTMLAGDIKMMGGKILPARLEMIPANKKGHKTVLIYHSLFFDKPLDDQFFSTQNMSRLP